MKIGFAQFNPTVGDIAGNTQKILNAYRELVRQGAELVLTPELAITGYPPQDLVFKSRFVPANLEALDVLRSEVGEVPLLVGYVDLNAGPGAPFRNAAALVRAVSSCRKCISRCCRPTMSSTRHATLSRLGR
jgi:predicted amidohydrolase